MNKEEAVQLSEISHRYGKKWCLVNVQLSLKKGECVSLLGPNGCGKTTFLKILATRLQPTLGKGIILGLDLRQNADAIRSQVEWLGHDLGIYKTLTAIENLVFSLHIRGQKSAKQQIQNVLDQVGLGKEGKKAVSTFSMGMRKRLALAKILLQNPSLILLDEPHANLDKNGKKLINDCIREWKQMGRTVFFSSHDHPDFLACCDREFILPGQNTC